MALPPLPEPEPLTAERPYAAVQREVLEEILLDIGVDRLLDTYLVDYECRGALVSVIELVFLSNPVD